MQYGSWCSRGDAHYETTRGVAIFRLRDSHPRLFDSGRIYRINIPFSAEAVNEAAASDRRQRAKARRPISSGGFRGYGEIGVTPKIEPPTEVAVSRGNGASISGHEARGSGVDALRVLLAAGGPEYRCRRSQGGRQLSVEPADRHGGAPARP